MFFCQRSCYAREYETRVVSCTPATRKLEAAAAAKAVNVAGFEVLFEDTVFFPEGGGQNTDKGFVGDSQVVDVFRRGDKAIHFVTGDSAAGLEVGSEVKQVLDWDRRFDNMQQHTGQHLVSAVLEKDYETKTVSWWMAESTPSKVGVSYIELDKTLTMEAMQAVEDKCNKAIREATPVTVSLYNLGDPELEQAHTRGLPADHTGPIRLVKIDNIDNNLCCGTHVSNLSHLQSVKLLFSESKKGKHFLYFLVGSRVQKYLSNTVERERALTQVLKCCAEEQLDLVEKMQKSLKINTKTNSSLLKEIAVMEANNRKTISPKPDYLYFYRKEGDNDYISSLTRELDGFLVVVIVGGDSAGQLVVTGPGDGPVLIGKKLVVLLDGKGGGKGSRFNAKITNFKNIDKVEGVIKETLLQTNVSQ